jgi:conjugal transfer/entry exclusion protein
MMMGVMGVIMGVVMLMIIMLLAAIDVCYSSSQWQAVTCVIDSVHSVFTVHKQLASVDHQVTQIACMPPPRQIA